MISSSDGSQAGCAAEETSVGSETGDSANTQDASESNATQGSGGDLELGLEEALRLVEELRGKCRSHAQQTYAWRRAHAAQELLVKQLVQEKNAQLSKISAQLLLFESRLRREKKYITATLARHTATISRQQRVIDALTARLIDNGLDTAATTAGVIQDFDSQNDSDSAVVMEDLDLDFHHGKQYRSMSGDGITIARSISDAIDNGFKHASSRRGNCYLRRPEVLETVYSVEEDSEQQQQTTTNGDCQRMEKSTAEKKREGFRNSSDRAAQESDDSDTWTYNSEKITAKEQTPKTQVTVYNRVMSNHRSVIKPKDVKYKRINKAKSKSLEELRGRLRNWVDKGNRHAPNLEQSQSYA